MDKRRLVADAARHEEPDVVAGAPGKAPVGTIELLGQSVAHIGPVASAALVLPAIAGVAGYGAWLSWVIGTVGALTIGYCIARMCRHFASSGSIYSLVERGLGPGVGFVIGGVIIIPTVLVIAVATVAFGVFFGDLLGRIGIDPTSIPALLLMYLGIVLVPAWIALRGIRLSTRLLLVVETMLMALICVLLVIGVLHHGTVVDRAQLSLRGVSVHGILLGVVSTILAFGGFESSAALGREAREPRRAVPAAVLGSIALAAVFFILNAYAQQLLFPDAKAFAADSNPLATIAAAAHVPAFQWLIALGVSFSLFANLIAIYTAVGRVLATMAEQKQAPTVLQTRHKSTNSPWVAIAVPAGIGTTFAVVAALTKLDPTKVIAYLVFLSGFGAMLFYTAAAVSAPVYEFRRRMAGTAITAVIGLVAVIVMGFVFYNTVHPAPASPLNVFPYVFAGIVVALGAVYYLVVRPRRTTEPSTKPDDVAIVPEA